MLGWVETKERAVLLAKKIEKEKEAKQAYVGRLESGKKVIFSSEQHIYPMMELADTKAIMGGNDLKAALGLAEDSNLLIEGKNGQIIVSVIVRDYNGKMIAEINKNEWKINPNNSWDRNYSKNSLEIKDPSGNVVLQLGCLKTEYNFQQNYIIQMACQLFMGKLMTLKWDGLDALNGEALRSGP